MSDSDFQALWEEMETIGDYYTRNTCLETLRRYDDALKQIEQLKEDLQEVNDNITWWANRFKSVERDNERLKAQLTDTEWEYQNTKCKYEKQYKKGITEEIIEDIETCFFNRENPSMIPIDSLDICHIFGYIDYLKDYKSRCEKAVDKLRRDYYINYSQHNDDVVREALNILQNGSENK